MNTHDLYLRSSTLFPRMGALAVAGAAVFFAGLLIQPERAWLSLLLASVMLLSIGLAGIVFVCFSYVSGASWSVALRRVPEAMAALLPVGGVGLLAVLFFHPSLYPWTKPAIANEMPPFRQWWLQLDFFRARAIVFLVVWTLIGALIQRASRKQDADAAPRHTTRNVVRSALFLTVFGLTYWIAAYDWIMSLQPDWASTLFGFYNFAGLFVSGLAVLVILLAWLRKRAPLNAIITTQHLHDCGKLMFAFSTFWMYLWFSQYMLIWYANIPEEATYYAQRQQGMWASLLLLNVALNWGLPFLVLLPKRNKQSAGMLVKVAIALLVGRWLDLYIMITPPFFGSQPQVGIFELAAMAGAVGIFAVVFFRRFRTAPAVPVNDPYLLESLHYHA
ncbi:MAG TPA: hypothetical protein VFM10_01440 [Terriglobales bacterium]|nr:hypothetical protein [Terriglobales bacterium]